MKINPLKKKKNKKFNMKLNLVGNMYLNSFFFYCLAMTIVRDNTVNRFSKIVKAIIHSIKINFTLTQ